MVYEYFILLGVCLIIPLIKSFSPEIDFYSKPARLVLAILIPFFIFISWDIYATSKEHWYFNSNYITGISLFGLPVEEIMFFIVIPFCGIFTWESVKYFMKNKS
jgi:lycopene cyclase domain-containing protein